MRPRKKLLIATFTLVLTGALGLGIALNQADPSALLERALKKAAPGLPFEIESIQVRKTWRELLRGRLASLNITVKKNGYRVRLIGPVVIRRDEKDSDLLIEYDPETTIEPLTNPEHRSPPLPFHFWIEVPRTFKTLNLLGLSVYSSSWKWDRVGLELKNLAAVSHWRDNRLHTRITVHSLNLKTADENHPFALDLNELALTQTAPLLLSPFEAGPELKLEADAKSMDLFWNGTLFSLPLEKFPLKIQALLGGAESPKLIDADASLGTLQFKASLQKDQQASIQWNLPELSLPNAAHEIMQAVPQWAPLIQKAGLRKGRIQTQGTASFPIPLHKSVPEVNAHVRITDLSLKPADMPLLIQGASTSLALSTRTGLRGHIEARRVAYQHLETSLGKTPFALTPKNRKLDSFDIQLGDGGPIPARSRDIPVEIGTLQGEARLPMSYNLKTSLQLPPTSTSQLTRPFCMSSTRIPPAKIEARFPRIEITEDSIDPTGEVHAEIFGGTIEAKDIGIFDLGTPVPELDFSAEVRNIRLEKIGEWLNFGEMKGFLEGYARDVTFQSWLPTRFDAQIQVKPPADRARVVFSPAAVQNFVEVVAGSNLESIPGLVKWYAFGTPRYIFGGYDIDYAGVKLTSSDGVIELETLDPPEIYKKEKKHFILYGASVLDRVPILGAVAWGGFRVPIQSPRYPVVMDAPAIANYIRQLTDRLGALSARSKKPEENQSDAENQECEPQETPSVPVSLAPAARGLADRNPSGLPHPERQHDPARSGSPARHG